MFIHVYVLVFINIHWQMDRALDNELEGWQFKTHQ